MESESDKRPDEPKSEHPAGSSLRLVNESIVRDVENLNDANRIVSRSLRLVRKKEA